MRHIRNKKCNEYLLRCVFQIWSEENDTRLFHVENRRTPVVTVQRQLLAFRHWSLHHRHVKFGDVSTVVRSR